MRFTLLNEPKKYLVMPTKLYNQSHGTHAKQYNEGKYKN